MLFDLGTSSIQGHDERFRQLIDCIEVDGIYMLDNAGHVLTWNRGAELNKGYTRQEILGKHFRIFFVPEDVAAGLPGSIRQLGKHGMEILLPERVTKQRNLSQVEQRLVDQT